MRSFCVETMRHSEARRHAHRDRQTEIEESTFAGKWIAAGDTTEGRKHEKKTERKKERKKERKNV